MTTGGNVLINCVGGTAARLLPDEGTRGYARIVHTPDEIVKEIHKQIKMGVDWIKVHVSGLPIRPDKEGGEISTWTLDELKLVCDTAHQFGIPVVGHCRNAVSTRDAAIDQVHKRQQLERAGLLRKDVERKNLAVELEKKRANRQVRPDKAHADHVWHIVPYNDGFAAISAKTEEVAWSTPT